MAYFSVDILTPYKVLAKDVSADDLLIPTTRGEINVLPEHTHLISKLDTGVLVCREGTSLEKFVVTTGIVKILEKKITVLAEVAEKADEIDAERAQMALEKAQHKINSDEILDDQQLEKFRRKLVRALVRTQLAKQRR